MTMKNTTRRAALRGRRPAPLAAAFNALEPRRLLADFAASINFQTQINRQARSNLQPPQADFGGVRKKVTLNLQGASFFDALDAFQKASGLTFQPQNDGWRAFPGQMDIDGGGKTFDSGAFRFVAQQATYSRTVAYSRNAASSDNFYFNFNGRAEPKIRTNEGQISISVDEARDDKGNDLAGGNNNSSNAYNQGYGIFNGNMQLRYPQDPGKKIVVLRGRLKMGIVKSWELIEVADVLSGRQVRAYEGISITFERAPDDGNNNRNQVAVRASIPWNGNNGRSLQAVQRAMTRVKVIDAAGNPLDSNGWDNNFDNQGQTMRYTLRFSHNGNGEPKPPFKLQIEAPRDTKEVEVPFEFRDLPMP